MSDEDAISHGRSAHPRKITLAVHYEPEQYAADGNRDIQVFLEVSTHGLDAASPEWAPERSEVIIIDCSGSMVHPTLHTMGAARKAAAAAIEALPDGTWFALIEGTKTARVCYPPPGASGRLLVRATPATRAAGRRAARALTAHGGTRISGWLERAREMLATRPGAAFRHVLLLTDGRDEHGAAQELRRVLDACAGVFTCDVLGIGEGWDAGQLLEIADRLGGRAEAADAGSEDLQAAADPERWLTPRVRALIGAAVGRTLSGLWVRVDTKPYLTVDAFRQLNPTDLDLKHGGRRVGDRLEFPTGAWGDETRWYGLCLRADPEGPGYPGAGQPEPDPVASVALVLDDTGDGGHHADTGTDRARRRPVSLPPEQSIRVRWTDERAPETDPGTPVGHFSRYQQMREAIQRGCAALYGRDIATAERQLGAAVQRAWELEDRSRLRSLNRLVDIEDAAAGRVRVREKAEVSVPPVVVNSSHVPSPGGGDGPSHEGGDGLSSGGRWQIVVCRQCDEQVPAGRFCTVCRHPLTEPS